ncbi:MAG TPA: cation diffusion facilitator family transporter [Hyphomicrobiaceae bacterium]|nr:cation diffusion facilitator family transporter [Hyphomicrobiaceae bacterium]
MVYEHDGHSHGHGAGTNETRVGIAALLTGVFMLAEVAGGLISGSLALLADAGHMLADFAALGLAWLGFRLARRPADWRRTYGFDRFSVLVAFGNGLALFVIAAWIVLEAARRLQEPVDVLGGMMLLIALAGLAVNLVAFFILRSGDRANLNVRAAALHVAGDLLGSVAALAAAAIIMLTGWTPIDPILSVLVALIILRSAWLVVRDAGHILLEGAPATLDTRTIREDLTEAVPGVIDVHHIHVWSITQERPMITLHARLRPAARPELVTPQIKARLRDRFRVGHATVEVEFDRCADQHVTARGENG